MATKIPATAAKQRPLKKQHILPDTAEEQAYMGYEVGDRVLALYEGDEYDHEYNWAVILKIGVGGHYRVKYEMDGVVYDAYMVYRPSLVKCLAEAFNATKVTKHEAPYDGADVYLPPVTPKVTLEDVKELLKRCCIDAGYKSQGKGSFPNTELNANTSFYVMRALTGGKKPTMEMVCIECKGTAAEPYLEVSVTLD